ncbi:hypothetical protein ElP_55060 [Tautonia plasticadhaerens]|uniref:Uncharacterized protein n=2 Tax=Tautonia plasticadhaerens TaxID=2527974 RepID=A0A518H9Z8_9BACT|nr:hypothetical protein ElP_55060 [Tautonia plasticadhaerens]
MSELPEWLRGGPAIIGRIPLLELLRGSVYYPAAGFDGSPVEFLGKEYHSFVYSDFGVTPKKLIKKLSTFRGYRPLAYREVEAGELMPNGLLPIPIGVIRRIEQKPNPFYPDFFACWAILQRTPDFGPDHGPSRFSLLYVRYEGVTTFHSLYRGNEMTPGVLAIICPGVGFGGNWTDFRDPDAHLAEAVLTNPSGVPSYLVGHGWCDPCPVVRSYWSTYPNIHRDLGPIKMFGIKGF